MPNLANIKSVRIPTPAGFLSWPNLFEPVARKPGHKPKFSATLMIPKENMADDDKERLSELWKTLIRYGATEFGTKAIKETEDGKIMPKFRTPGLVDGDESEWPGNHGFHLIKASANEGFPPLVLNSKNETISSPEGVKWIGHPAELVLGIFAYSGEDIPRGISFNLIACRLLEGEGIMFETGAKTHDSVDEVLAVLGSDSPQLERQEEAEMKRLEKLIG